MLTLSSGVSQRHLEFSSFCKCSGGAKTVLMVPTTGMDLATNGSSRKKRTHPQTTSSLVTADDEDVDQDCCAKEEKTQCSGLCERWFHTVCLGAVLKTTISGLFHK
ncbi:UNVERIFIED_CONTAM: hypothetical protein HDU68_007493 [Siphonaria sp. JEL0065]|nr:hypothetical protein HDU68_007493 [Siphonaria sp. JEL0065]